MDSIVPECTICSEGYEVDGRKVPILLDCGHTFCRDCISQLEIALDQKCFTCQQSVLKYDNKRKVQNLKKNYELVQILEQIVKEKERNQLVILIACCPASIQVNHFRDFFVTQLENKPDAPILMHTQEQSFIQEKVIELVYPNVTNRGRAAFELHEKVYRYGLDINQSCIIVSLNEEREKQLPKSFKASLQKYDFVMIQYNVPMMRNTHTDLIRIDHPPVGFNYRDALFLEKQINYTNGLKIEQQDLAVRYYSYQNIVFVVIYVGSCGKIERIIEFLKQSKFDYTSQRVKATIEHQLHQPNNYLQFKRI
ncbi:e3 ubiquitin-protein ligase trim23-like [Stylonychia lemnae]|uniref:E3 ubiquitin-protein ligase trim23-like n=1 Tax=Stylonychia lemnae TaxID=5949 RepID=A0A078A2X8_STYLE|nr:e3 ubiquitin-protein ligase trim23-like [Stylonychia lemnae]|eukprot:CDW75129.1 e3 ubiquitin-protein ligase trim23-like [Stylonychia lemnae]